MTGSRDRKKTLKDNTREHVFSSLSPVPAMIYFTITVHFLVG
jgi:hypothetical protein